ncbi:MAG: right-handed parallel beta-helix repeat-containing protein, partial [Deltaproteobacteria bacterium]|nr:right-handed parallel beta-helix repeat-containing protein [Deltaproteobacteria bacterium]
MGRHHLAILSVTCMLTMLGCGDEGATEGPGGGGTGGGGGDGGGGAPPTPCADDEFDLGNGQCLPCPPGTLEVADGCQSAGVLPGGCAEGFVHDGDVGCEPTLPPAECPAGQMAVPGDTACREIAPCGNAPWGDIVTDGTTVYVDGSYTGGTSDGSATHPWTTIGQAVSAATEGAVIAIAEGSYAEDLMVSKAVALWGRCPALVELVGSGSGLSTLRLSSGASGSTVRGLAVVGPTMGILVWGASDVALHELWIHDNGDRGVDLEQGANGSSVTLSDSLIEDNQDHGAIATGATLTVERSLVRGTQPWNGIAGPGLGIQADPQTGEQAVLTVRGSLISGNHDAGVGVYGGTTTVDGSVIRDTLPGASGAFGRGMSVQPDHVGGVPAVVTVTRSLLEQNQEVGIFNGASTLTVEDTVIRDTVVNAQGHFGRGLAIEAHPFNGEPASLEVTRSLIADSAETHLFSWGSHGTLRASVLRTTRRGLSIQLNSDLGHPSTVEVEGCVIDDSSSVGVNLHGATATITGTAILGAALSTDYNIRGISVQHGSLHNTATSLSLSRSTVGHHQGTAVAVFGASLWVDQCLVHDTMPDVDSTYGDAFGIQSGPDLADATVSNSL